LKAALHHALDGHQAARKRQDRQRATAEKTGAAAGHLLAKPRRLRSHLMDRFDDDPEILMTDERYGFIAGIVKEVLVNTNRQRIDMSRNIDLVLTNRFLGFPIFFFHLGHVPADIYPRRISDAGDRSTAVDGVSAVLAHLLPQGLIRDLLLDGIVAGVGSVIVFLPNILILFFCIAIFEDTGYMARSAFLMDKSCTSSGFTASPSFRC
jgi:ferrous iron transport protein B